VNCSGPPTAGLSELRDLLSKVCGFSDGHPVSHLYGPGNLKLLGIDFVSLSDQVDTSTPSSNIVFCGLGC
jgi:hypothetical protein